MNQRQIGAAIFMVGGLVLATGGVLNFLDNRPATPADPEPVAEKVAEEAVPEVPAETEPTEADDPPAVQPEPTTATTAPTSTTTTQPTTTQPTTTTTTIAGATLVEQFIATFAAALEAGDSDLVFSMLHPGLVDGYGEALCRNWVEAEIMALSEYALTGGDHRT